MLAVTNPKGSYNPRDSLETNTGLSGPLLSRFDLVVVLKDAKSTEWDATVSEHILTSHQAHHPHTLPNLKDSHGESKVRVLHTLSNCANWVVKCSY